MAVSFESPEYTTDVDAMGTLRVLEAIRSTGLVEHTRFYQASTSELYGLVQNASKRDDAILPKVPVRRGQAVFILDNCELQRSLRNVCM